MSKHKNNKPHISPVLRVMQLTFMAFGPLFPRLMGNWAYKLWFTPARFKTPLYEMKADDSAQRTNINVNGKAVSVLKWGDGPAVLFIHGWMGRGSQAGHFIDDLIIAGYSVISFDAPAHGRTPGKQTSIFEISDVLLELNRRYGPFEAAITHSFGGMVLAYAMSNGLKVNKAVNICPIADVDILIKSFQQSLRIPDKAVEFMLRRLTDTYGADLPEKISTVNNVKAFEASALVVHDEDDRDIPWQSGKAIADAWRGSRFVLTRGLGHRRILRDPEIIHLVTGFIINEPGRQAE